MEEEEEREWKKEEKGDREGNGENHQAKVSQVEVRRGNAEAKIKWKRTRRK